MPHILVETLSSHQKTVHLIDTTEASQTSGETYSGNLKKSGRSHRWTLAPFDKLC